MKLVCDDELLDKGYGLES
ncbi:Protein of unknown function [Bacillus cereus]|nr:Protein of unknown function [Bacillus cereus]